MSITKKSKIEDLIEEKVEHKISITKPVKRFTAVRVAQFHPYQRVRIPVGSPGVILEDDSWVQCQVDAGILKEI